MVSGGSMPAEHREAMALQVYGCDICEDVCPFNREAQKTGNSEFQARQINSRESLLEPNLVWLAGLNEEQFRAIFRGSAVKRTKWQGLVRNACIALGNAGLSRGNAAHGSAVAVLE